MHLFAGFQIFQNLTNAEIKRGKRKISQPKHGLARKKKNKAEYLLRQKRRDQRLVNFRDSFFSLSSILIDAGFVFHRYPRNNFPGSLNINIACTLYIIPRNVSENFPAGEYRLLQDAHLIESPRLFCRGVISANQALARRGHFDRTCLRTSNERQMCEGAIARVKFLLIIY